MGPNQTPPLLATVHRLALGYWRRQLRLVLLSALLMFVANSLYVLVPMSAKELVSYSEHLTPSSSSSGVNAPLSPQPSQSQQSRRTVMMTSPFVRSLNGRVGHWSEQAFRPLVSLALRRLDGVLPHDVLRHDRAPANLTSDPDDIPPAIGGGGGDGDLTFTEGLLCRCLFMATVILCYHILSCLAHVAAHAAGAATQTDMVHDSLSAVLDTPSPERVAVANAAALSQVITSSARTCGDTLAAILTDGLSAVLTTATTVSALLYLSVYLTVTIGGLVATIQVVYLVGGRRHSQSGAALAAAEGAVQAQLSNALQRSETVFVFDCRAFVLGRLREKLAVARHVSNRCALGIHGFAGANTAMTSLVFVVVLGICNALHRRGDLEITDVALYFLFLRQFVNQLTRLANEFNRIRSALARLRTLQSTLEWFRAGDTDHPERDNEGSKEDGTTVECVRSSPRVHVSDAGDGRVGLTDVCFTYPVPPSFLRASAVSAAGAALAEQEEPAPHGDGARRGGVQGLTVDVPPQRITVIYGPSGCGKSTCLRLLSRLVRPGSGTVHTHARCVLLEQQHAIFLGTAAENIALDNMTDLLEEREASDSDASSKKDAVVARAMVREAATLGGCANFLSDPFAISIDSVDHPPFSGGQLQRICLARIFYDRRRAAAAEGDVSPAADPCTLVLLDEPTTGLDAAAVDQLLGTIKALKETHGKTVVISSHDGRVLALADHLVDLSLRAHH